MNAKGDFIWLVMVMIGLFIAWVLFGSRGGIGGPFIRPPAPLGSGGTYGDSITQGVPTNLDDIVTDVRDLGKKLKELRGRDNSPYNGIVTISRYSNAKKTDPNEEQIELKVARGGEDQINITGWRLESAVSGAGDNIDQGAYLPYSGRVNLQQNIFLRAGDKVYITTGRSPIGTSFQLNQCTGYFEQFQDFKPTIRKSCPKPIDDLPNLGLGDTFDRCIDFVEDLPRCEVILGQIPLNIGSQCMEFVSTKVNYNNCVINHKEDSDFYKNEWRIYLGRSNELWKSKREIIKLLDQNGKLVDAISY